MITNKQNSKKNRLVKKKVKNSNLMNIMKGYETWKIFFIFFINTHHLLFSEHSLVSEYNEPLLNTKIHVFNSLLFK